MDSIGLARITCEHTGPVLVNPVEGGHRAQCLSCGFIGPVRETTDSAWHEILPPENSPEPGVKRCGRYARR